jgi:hypothetical protein
MKQAWTGRYTYDVVGQFEGQEDADHWASFSTPEEAKNYQSEQLAAIRMNGSRLHLAIYRVREMREVR